MASYAYEKNGDHEVRILCQNPGSFPDDLVGSLSSVRLLDNPKYEALPYTVRKLLSSSFFEALDELRLSSLLQYLQGGVYLSFTFEMRIKS
jgi:hypothetical protein